MAVFLVLFIVLVSQSAAKLYDTKIEVCCSGNVLELSIYDRKNMLCCGTALYNHSTSRCCDGRVLDKPNDEGSVCCGDTWYVANKNQRCCKNTLYSLQKQMCNPITGEVIDIDVQQTLNFCGTKVYNKTDQICSYTNIADAKMAKICNKAGNVAANSCCGETAYDPRTDICCIDTIHPLYSDPDNLTIVNECCGRSIFQVDGYNAYFDRSNLICCGDAVVERSSIYEDCCGSQIYNVSNSVCCNGVVTENPAINNVCCGTASYNSATSVCCDGNVYPMSFSSQDCCIDPEILKQKQFNIFQYFNGEMQRFGLELGLTSPFTVKKLRQYVVL